VCVCVCVCVRRRGARFRIAKDDETMASHSSCTISTSKHHGLRNSEQALMVKLVCMWGFFFRLRDVVGGILLDLHCVEFDGGSEGPPVVQKRRPVHVHMHPLKYFIHQMYL